MTFRTASHWVTRDGSGRGDLGSGRSYRVRPCCIPGEGQLFRLLWNGKLAEFLLLGMSVDIVDKPRGPSGQEVTEIVVKVHVRRRFWFYFWKVLLPLYNLMGLSMFSFAFDVSDLSSRLDLLVTLFLASVALLYVVAEHLPKTNYL